MVERMTCALVLEKDVANRGAAVLVHVAIDDDRTFAQRLLLKCWKRDVGQQLRAPTKQRLIWQ